MKDSTIGGYYEDKRKEAERLRREIKAKKQEMEKPVTGKTHARLLKELHILEQMLELALYVGD